MAPTAAEEAKRSVAVDQAAVVIPSLSKPEGLAAAQEATPTAGPTASGRTNHGSKEPVKKQLERLARKTLANLAKTFDGSRTDAEAIDPVPGSSDPSSTAQFGKLGKQASVFDERTLRLAKYIKPGLPVPPSQTDFSIPVKDWGMMLNDKIGDCTVAAGGHSIQQWTANATKQITPSDESILSAYKAISGYVPGHPETDNGANMLDVLKYWRKSGIADRKIGAFASVEPTNFNHVRAAIWIFGGAYLGLNLPKSAQKQEVWDVPAGGPRGPGRPGSWGGHAVNVAGFGPKGLLIVTWGALKWMSWEFLKAYGDEIYAIISEDFLVEGKTPNNGFDMETLKTDLKLVEMTNRLPGFIPKWMRQFYANLRHRLSSDTQARWN